MTLEYLGKGKRGVTYTTMRKGRTVVVKEKRREAAVDTISHEAAMLRRLNPFGIGPRYIEYRGGRLVREYIKGEEFADYLAHSSKREVLRVLSEVFIQCRVMDLLGINKLEMTRPYKHVLVCSEDTRTRKKGDVVQIDFERCKESERPKNVTQFVQCVCRGRLTEIFRETTVSFDARELMRLSREYKNSYSPDTFKAILKTIGITPLEGSFSERVYEECMRIPRGSVVTYKELARRVGTRSPRAVGQALRRNPYAPRVPCHRVVASDGTIGGYAGATGGKKITRKKKLLEEEGVTFEKGRVER